jgi:hypothetical protein
MKNRKRETCTSGTVRDEGGNILIYSANDRGDRGNVGIIRSPVRASILPNHTVDWRRDFGATQHVQSAAIPTNLLRRAAGP